MAIAMMPPPPRPLEVLVDVVVGTTVGVVTVGVVAGADGTPGANGFCVLVPCASAVAGTASARPTAMRRGRSRKLAYASGCSIAGVSGAST